MAAYGYRALDAGREVRGVVQADSARHARAQLRERGLLPLDVAAERRAVGSTGFGWARERALILRQMAALLGAGLPLDEVLALSASQVGRARVERSLATVRAGVIEGQSLSVAMDAAPGLFPALIRRSVAAAEQSGALEAVIERLATHAERQLATMRNVVVALVYPLLLVLISLAVVWGLLAYVVPRVVGVFETSRQELPAMTRSLLGLSDWIAAYGAAALAGIALLVLFLTFLFRRPGPRLWRDRFLLRVPLVGRLLRVQAAALFSRTLAILVNSAVPAVEALRASAEVMSNHQVRADLQRAAARVREGASIHAALADNAWLPPLTRRLIQGGEQAGELGRMLEHAADLQEADLADAGQVLTAVLQPVLILLVGLAVLYIVLAILLPIMNLSQLLG